MVADAAVVEPLHPVLTHELAIRQQAVDALRTEELDIALYQLYPLLRVGGALLRQYAEQQRVGHPIVTTASIKMLMSVCRTANCSCLWPDKTGLLWAAGGR